MKTLILQKGEVEHPLFRACMEVVVAIRQKHCDEVKSIAANNLERLALEYIDLRPERMKA